jgi:uncharacterized protein YkwD
MNENKTNHLGLPVTHKYIVHTSMTIMLTSLLVACGGSGGGGDSSSMTPSSPAVQPVPGTLSTPQYASTSAQLAAFNLLNQYRQQCGFPALQENTVLDTAAQNHAKYMGLNSAVSDTEVSGNPGFTGTTYVARAVVAGFPRSAFGSGVSAGYSTNVSTTEAKFGENLVYQWLSGVYHLGAVMYPINTIGIGVYETQTADSGYTFTNVWGTISLLNTQAQPMSNTPLTFPCQGVTGIAYTDNSESPTPPNASGTGWGTPVMVMGNSIDNIVLKSASMSGPSGSVSLQILNSSTDPNKEIQSYEAVAYPTSPLSPNTTYNVSLTGTMNGTAFSRSFTFTTGNAVG